MPTSTPTPDQPTNGHAASLPAAHAPLVARARQYAIECHRDTNHRYDDQPYEIHLQGVFDFGCTFARLLPDEASREVALAACWTHDTIEDCRQTYNDVKNALGAPVAELTYALTNDKGRTRQERAGDRYYEGIRASPLATFVKLCDRLANVRYSKETNPRMLEVYRRENDHFRAKLWLLDHQPLWDDLAALLA